MKAKRKSDGRVIEVTERTSWNGEKIYTTDGTFYRKHELDFSVNETKEAEGDLRISLSKLREILEQAAEDYNAPQYFVDEIINQVKKSI